MTNADKLHLETALKSNIRYDNRKHDEFRQVSVEKGVIATAEGSARVKIGDTEVIAGVKMELGTPYPDSPDEGSLMVGAEFLPMASPEFELGPPGIDAIELARVVDRGIREGHAMDVKKLCIEAGKKIWIVVIDICTINDNGNLQDASALATLAAIEDAHFPVIENVDGDYTINYKEKTDKKLPLLAKPITATVFKVGKALFVDPTRAEQKSYDARLSVSVLENGKLCAMQKGGEGVLTVEETNKMVELAVKKTKELRKHI